MMKGNEGNLYIVLSRVAVSFSFMSALFGCFIASWFLQANTQLQLLVATSFPTFKAIHWPLRLYIFISVRS